MTSSCYAELLFPLFEKVRNLNDKIQLQNHHYANFLVNTEVHEFSYLQILFT